MTPPVAVIDTMTNTSGWFPVMSRARVRGCAELKDGRSIGWHLGHCLSAVNLASGLTLSDAVLVFIQTVMSGREFWF